MVSLLGSAVRAVLQLQYEREAAERIVSTAWYQIFATSVPLYGVDVTSRLGGVLAQCWWTPACH